MRSYVAMLVALALSALAYAGDGDIPVPKDLDADFYVLYTQCKMMAAPLLHTGSADSVKIKEIPGKKGLACERMQKKKLRCIESEDSGGVSAFEGSAVFESTDDMIIASSGWAYILTVSTSLHAAVLEKRLGVDKGAAVIMCHADFMTADEAKAMMKAKPPSKP